MAPSLNPLFRRDRRFLVFPSRQRYIDHDVAKSFQARPLRRRFRCGSKYGHPRCSCAGITVFDAIPVLHFDAYESNADQPESSTEWWLWQASECTHSRDSALPLPMRPAAMARARLVGRIVAVSTVLTMGGTTPPQIPTIRGHSSAPKTFGRAWLSTMDASPDAHSVGKYPGGALLRPWAPATAESRSRARSSKPAWNCSIADRASVTVTIIGSSSGCQPDGECQREHQRFQHGPIE